MMKDLITSHKSKYEASISVALSLLSKSPKPGTTSHNPTTATPQRTATALTSYTHTHTHTYAHISNKCIIYACVRDNCMTTVNLFLRFDQIDVVKFEK